MEAHIADEIAVATPSPTRRAGAPVVLEARGVEKSFRIPAHKVDTLRERMTNPFAHDQYRELRALDGTSPSTSIRASSSASSAATGRARALC